MSRRPVAQINLAALAHNLRRVQQLAPASKVLAVLKANAYGHGLVRVAQALAEADAFAVARIDEALALRTAGVVKPIVLLEGFYEAAELPVLLANNLQTVVHNELQLQALEQAELEGQLKIWLKIDTGMHRLGVAPEQFAEFYRRLWQCSAVQPGIRIMSHFSCADFPGSAETVQQLTLFKQLCADKAEQQSLANSAAIISLPQSHGDWVRPGLMLHGISPLPQQHGQLHLLQPVMRLSSRLIAMRQVKQGETVGYGGHWRASTATWIGVIAIGYGDGYPRHARNNTPVWLEGREVKLVGRVSMDMITVDLGQSPTENLGAEAVLWGPELAIERVAECADTIPYELLCNITPRVDYQYVTNVAN
ncbi:MULTISPECIES: alanine racemase [unclassified Arsukibacterium]|uniref:alanine racemase n=1 Tax=unclassified Arsukibacterium TaxID=2635278 RepID=UPI000C4D84E9|nr:MULTISPECIES: alanine racemase [unclassified Arsukibacterium]MBM33619.1 alanine racemase [Rheinheimera sp.]|tara:strand:+ start:168353 stop:169444 length:1092 start_codon:yes stop_codon:yes gene_type:complete